METRIRNNMFSRLQIVLYRFAMCGVLPKTAVASAFERRDRIYMERSSTKHSAERILLESELQRWFAGQGVSEEGAATLGCEHAAGAAMPKPVESQR